MILSINYKELPPSSNKIYIRGTILSTHARTYAERFAHFMATHHGHQLSDIDPEGVFALHLRVFFETLVNEGWNQRDKMGQRKSKSRFKKIDVSNRIKLVEDCVRDAIAVDDSHTFALSQEKHHCPENPHIEIYVQQVDPSMFGIPKEFL